MFRNLFKTIFVHCPAYYIFVSLLDEKTMFSHLPVVIVASYKKLSNNFRKLINKGVNCFHKYLTQSNHSRFKEKGNCKILDINIFGIHNDFIVKFKRI